jgi:hypothetical protein
MFADPGTGDMDDAIDAGKGREVDLAAVRVPAHVAGLERAAGPDQRPDAMTAAAQVIGERTADQPGRPRDRDLHRVIVPCPATSGIRPARLHLGPPVSTTTPGRLSAC